MMNFLLLLLTSAGVCLTAVSGEVERRLNVSEAAPPGTIVGHIDARGPVPGGQPNFYIVYPNPNGRAENDLNVNEVSGEITVKRILDFETTREYVLLAVPTDGSPGIRVTVEVLDENDNAPVFPVDQIQLEISEYARMQAEMPLPSATDADSGAYGVQKYRISGGNVNNVFRLATKKLNEVLYVDLVVNGELDREYRDHYDLEIEALDAGEPPKRGTLRVHVQTLDANDNAPEFLKPRYMATVPATATVDDEVLQVQARDADIGENARISYRFSQSRSNVAPKFRIEEPTGIIRVFDAHLVHGSIHELLVVASDHGLPQPLESTAFVTITVASGKDSGSLASLDIVWLTDDGQPQLFENVTIGAVLARISVVSAQKSELSMTGSTVICMRQSESSNIYLLIVCGPLNRESDASYRLAFVLKSVPEGNVLLEQPVVVEVNDVNDNAPEWSQDTYRIAVNRSSLHDAVVYQFIARDADEGENGRLRYQLSGTDVFKIDERTGILTMTREMDCAMGAEVKFTIAASDHGKPPLTSSCTVIVDITDLNAKPPVFEKTLYEVTVKEDADVGTCLLKVGLYYAIPCLHKRHLLPNGLFFLS
ncbi:hypothetical protein QR680_013877 [Steinernema hermaphroditum]|uniref:Cadherin domain-containing protein n=1 Tax=Steinernema hermaphroditum TaxID=289476 RepID=A0AA39I925_9BILA|nr:hypothetical protein QR680_013877 [Steinernema hermaphroditum]